MWGPQNINSYNKNVFVSPIQAKTTYFYKLVHNYHVTLFTSLSPTLSFILPNSSHSLFSTMEDGDWVLVRSPSQKDLWNPSSPNAADNEPSRPLKLTFSAPAKYWTDAIPIGNGRLGAMVWGGVQTELLQLNGKSVNLSFFFLFSVPIFQIFSLFLSKCEINVILHGSKQFNDRLEGSFLLPFVARNFN